MAEEFIGSKDRIHVFELQPLVYKIRYYRNVLVAGLLGRISLRSCRMALQCPYVALVSKRGYEMILVSPSAVELSCY